MNITQEQLEQDILTWITEFVEVPQAALGGWSPCPYARKARLEGTYEVRIGTSLLKDLMTIGHDGMGGREVVVFAYDPEQYVRDQFALDLEFCNDVYLLPNNILALEDHPADPEIVNGVCMNQGKYALALVQSLSDLDEKAAAMARKGFYDTWPADYLKMLFRHRQDPRK